MSLFMNLRRYKLIWKEDDVLKGMSPLNLNEALKKQYSLAERGVRLGDIRIYRIEKNEDN